MPVAPLGAVMASDFPPGTVKSPVTFTLYGVEALVFVEFGVIAEKGGLPAA